MPNSHQKFTSAQNSPQNKTDLTFIWPKDSAHLYICTDNEFAEQFAYRWDSLQANQTEITGQLEEISSTLSEMSILLSTPGNSELVIALIVAFFSAVAGAGAAFGFSFLQTKLLQSRNAISAWAREIQSLVVTFEEEATQYWLRPAKAIPEDLRRIQEHKITHLARIIAETSDRLNQLPQQAGLREVTKKIQSTASELYDIATEGEFELPNRECCQTTANEIGLRCSVLRTTLLELTQL
jgi:hypothetical protein